jgi:hypothetical protein
MDNLSFRKKILEFIKKEKIEAAKSIRELLYSNQGNSYMAGTYEGELIAFERVIDFINENE